MNDELGDRVVYAPRGRNAEDDLAACILAAAKIFQMDGQLVWITDGKRVPVFRGTVVELCRRFIVTAHPVNRGTEAEPNWVVEYRAFEPTELTIRNLIRESLPKRAPVVQPEATPRPPKAAGPGLPDDHPEMIAGRRVAAKYTETGNEQLRQEMEAGQRTAARYQERAPAAGS
jgi:hypothetical protein